MCMYDWKKKGAGLFAMALLLFGVFAEFYWYENRDFGNSTECVSVETQTQATEENQKVAEEKQKKIAYLSFDDGPSQNTERVLDVLKIYNIKATFFLIGENITPKREKLLERLKEEGHVIGIHTYSHDAKKMYTSAKDFEEDFLKAEKSISPYVDEDIKLCRFPWGSANKYLKKIEGSVIPWLQERGYAYFDWNVSGEDSVGCPTCSSIYKNVKKDVFRYDNPVILLHDSGTCDKTVQVLPDVIALIKSEGYQFDTLDHMASPYQYPRN